METFIIGLQNWHITIFIRMPLQPEVQGSSMAPFRCVPAHSHWFEIVVDKHLEEDATSKPWTVDVTHLVASTTLLQDKVV